LVVVVVVVLTCSFSFFPSSVHGVLRTRINNNNNLGLPRVHGYITANGGIVPKHNNNNNNSNNNNNGTGGGEWGVKEFVAMGVKRNSYTAPLFNPW